MVSVIETIEGLLFPLRRVLVELVHCLRARVIGVMRFIIESLNEDDTRTDNELGLSMASRDAGHFSSDRSSTTGARPAAVGHSGDDTGCNQFEAPAVVQVDLFNSSAKQLFEWNTLIEKLSARWVRIALDVSAAPAGSIVVTTTVQPARRPSQAFVAGRLLWDSTL